MPASCAASFWALAHVEVLLSMAMSVGFTLVYWYHGSFLHMQDLDWTLLSVALVFPLTAHVKEAFGRREKALNTLALFHSLTLQLLELHMRWEWHSPTGEYNGREVGHADAKKTAHPVSKSHVHNVQKLLLRLTNAAEAYLLLPRSLSARSVACCDCGNEEQRELEHYEDEGDSTVQMFLARLHGATEDLKKGGLALPEVIRIDQYVQMSTNTWEELKVLKRYRTPQAERSFCRVMVHSLPTLYGPYFVHVAKADSDEQCAIAFACVYAALLSLLLSGLFRVALRLENPFCTSSIDTVRVRHELTRVRSGLEALFDDWKANPVWSAGIAQKYQWADRGAGATEPFVA
eukprot:TRINITY_DN11392_c0_g1_i1.p1 TRINITY_DN11392_c0_g1~~TRINITY_DN11392_c0_g1_i1.p1  ORF type:complete len:347 (+),score=100.24 TRINITY_DN11392_c0_g1_i1:180-1220(+)